MQRMQQVASLQHALRGAEAGARFLAARRRANRLLVAVRGGGRRPSPRRRPKKWRRQERRAATRGDGAGLHSASHPLRVGSRLTYEGAFGLTRDRVRAHLDRDSPLLAHVPTHHALYIGNGRVVHFTGGHDTWDPNLARVVVGSLEELKRTAAKKGTKVRATNEPGADTPPNIVRRCLNLVKEYAQGRGERYSLMGNNCEDVVTYCITGKRGSRQRDRLLAAGLRWLSEGR